MIDFLRGVGRSLFKIFFHRLYFHADIYTKTVGRDVLVWICSHVSLRLV